jgi:hypothetical protein
MKPEPADKKKGWSLSLNATEISDVEKLIARNGGTDRTEFTLKALAFYDGMQPSRPDLLQNLAAAFHPTAQAELAEALATHVARNPKLNQARLVMYFIEAITKALGDPGFTGRTPFELVDGGQLAQFEAVSEERVLKLAREIAVHQERMRAEVSSGSPVEKILGRDPSATPPAGDDGSRIPQPAPAERGLKPKPRR